MQESTAQLLDGLPNKTTYQGKLIIFTSFYNSQCLAQYTQSLVATSMVLERLGIKWDFWPVFGDFHVERAVNDTYQRVLDDPEVTDILTIDSDESWEPMAVLRLLAHNEPIVGCAYKMKNRWDQWTALLKTKDGVPVGRMLADGTALIEAERLPWGFLRLKRGVLERYRDHFTDLRYEGRNGKTTIFCQQQYRDGIFFSHDYVFSERLKEMGYHLWCDPNATIGHYGIKEYSGNLDESLKALKTVQEEDTKTAAAFAAVQAMAADIEQRAA